MEQKTRKMITSTKIILVLLFSVILIAGCTNKSQIANPASVNCEEKGGTVDIRTDLDGSQTGYCKFSDGSECEEWAFYRGECNKTESI